MTEIIRGRLTPEERDNIDTLSMTGMSSKAIAKRMRRHPSTINFYMVTHGLKEMTGRLQPDCQRRNGSVVRGFTPDEDAFIQALRCQDFSWTRIAKIAGARFGYTRTAATIGVRLKMLASRDAA